MHNLYGLCSKQFLSVAVHVSMGCCSEHFVYAFEMHNLCGLCSAYFVWALVVHSAYGLFKCTVFMGCCSAAVLCDVVKHNLYMVCCCAHFVWAVLVHSVYALL